MRTQSPCLYRGYGILVQMAESPSFNGTERRFSMSWSIERKDSVNLAGTDYMCPSKVVILIKQFFRLRQRQSKHAIRRSVL